MILIDISLFSRELGKRVLDCSKIQLSVKLQGVVTKDTTVIHLSAKLMTECLVKKFTYLVTRQSTKMGLQGPRILKLFNPLASIILLRMCTNIST